MEPPPHHSTLTAILEHWVIPAETPAQRLVYHDRVADIFHDLMEEYQDVLDNHFESPSRPDPYDARLHDALYRIQLMSMALTEGHYRIAALALETTGAYYIFGNNPVMRLAMSNLCSLYPHVTRDTTEDIALWLLQQYGSRMQTCTSRFHCSATEVPIPHDEEPPR